jgi:hypothetical protein
MLLSFQHRPFDIENEIYRKNNQERIFMRGKEQFEKENAVLKEHQKIESQILKVEQEDERRLKLLGKQMGIRIPWVVPSTLIDPRARMDQLAQ